MNDFDGEKFKKNGEPTSQYMKWLQENNPKEFNVLQDKFFTTKGTMGSNPLKDIARKIMKGKKDGK
jgi:hypothetical protein